MKNQKNNFIKLTDFHKQNNNIFVDKTTIYMFYTDTNNYNKAYTHMKLSLPGGRIESFNVVETCEEVLELLNNYEKFYRINSGRISKFWILQW